VTSLVPLQARGTQAAPDKPTTNLTRTSGPRVGTVRWRRLVAAGDVVTAAMVLAVLDALGLHEPLWSALLIISWMAALAATGGYDAARVPFWPDEVRRVWLAAVCLAACLPFAAGLLSRPLEHVPGWTLTVVLLAGASTSQRWLIRAVGALRYGGRVGALRIVVAGHRRDVERIVTELGHGGFRGYDVVAACVVPPGAPDVVTRMAESVRGSAADALLVVPCRHLEATDLRRLSWQLEQSQARLLVSTSLLDVSRGRAHLAYAGGLSLVSVREARTDGAMRLVKELTERALAAVALVVLAPLLLALAAMIRIDSPGPALFRQTRTGKGGRAFSMVKLRTMHVGAEDQRPALDDLDSSTSVLFKLREDPRITRVGRVLRRYSLDELPQLLNVVRGEMALVGPRPPLPDEVAQYESDVMRRLAVKPGITGLWQVSGRSDLSWEDSVRLDLRYVDNWSLGHDWLILARTLGAVVGHRGAY
jgi:exopolysaccharide biosynthesis polyprenyl glycosylphosphotransferase